MVIGAEVLGGLSRGGALVVALILEAHGYEVVLKNNGEDAVAAFRENPDGYRAVVVDHSMPGMNGAQVIEAIRALRPDIPIVHASGYRDVVDDVEDVVFLPKPYDAESLISGVSNAISARR